MNLKMLSEEIMAGRRLRREEDLSFFETADLEALCHAGNQIREYFCGNNVDLCSIINGRSGQCSENCKFCTQSAHNHTTVEAYTFLNQDTLVADCKKHADKGVHRYSIVTAGRGLEGEDLKKACDAYKKMSSECRINLCASHGLLSKEAYIALKESGVTRYHENIETSKRNFPAVCTTHTYEDKINGIKLAQSLGFEVCSGGIIGLGETFEDRLDMAISLSELGIASIPLNALMPMVGTPFENIRPLTEAAILRVLAMFRFINPTAYIRLAAGRKLMENSGEKAFLSGANATITGDLLTTSGNNIEQDIDMLTRMGFQL